MSVPAGGVGEVASGDAHLRETCLATEVVEQGQFLQWRRDRVQLPDGRQAVREYVVHPGAVMIVAALPDGRLVMERQFRYPVGRTMIEFPAGKLDPGEGGLACAQRELLEEFRQSLEGDSSHSPKANGWFEGVRRFFGDL